MRLRAGARFLAAAFVLAALAAPAGAVSIRDARMKVVRRTMEYLNVPYLWGGVNPETGLDCSGFVQLVYRHAGLEIPRVSRDQFKAAAYVRPQDVLPGDMIFFAMKNPGTARIDHVGIYMGKGFFVHASFTNGIHINHISQPYYFQRLVAVRKYRGF